LPADLILILFLALVLSLDLTLGLDQSQVKFGQIQSKVKSIF